jgi:hypothetical protein
MPDLRADSRCLLCLPCCLPLLLLVLQMRVEEPQQLQLPAAAAIAAAPSRQPAAVPALAAMLPWSK